LSKPRRGGRPPRAASEALRDNILDAATDLFLKQGYGATSIEAVARRVGIAKRTFYHRFADKTALLAAVVHRIIERLRPPASVPLIQGDSPEKILEQLAALILRAALTPQAVALHRLLVAESARFPKLAAVFAREGASDEVVKLIAGVLVNEARAGRLTLQEPQFAARQFLTMVVAIPQRRALGLGPPISARERRLWPRKVVDLFLYGCRKTP
jgi:AcrR family transcriptional regulator